MRRAQISYDLLAITIFILFIFLIIFEIYIVESSEVRIIENSLNAKRIANMVARGINEVLLTNGTSTQVSLPSTLDSGESYFLSIKGIGRRVDIFWSVSSSNTSLSLPLLTSNVTELNITKTAGSGVTVINIRNLNGLVNVSPVCGDGVCDTGEDCDTCVADCGCVSPLICCTCGPNVCMTSQECDVIC